MSNYTKNTKKNTDLHQQMPAQNLKPKMVRQDIRNYAVGKDQTTASRKLNKEEKMEVDRTHTEETSHKHHTTITYMEHTREEKKRKAEKQTRDTENKRKKMGYTGRAMEKKATNRQEWRTMVDGLCSQRANRLKLVKYIGQLFRLHWSCPEGDLDSEVPLYVYSLCML